MAVGMYEKLNLITRSDMKMIEAPQRFSAAYGTRTAEEASPISSTHVVRRIYRRKHGAPVQGAERGGSLHGTPGQVDLEG